MPFEKLPEYGGPGFVYDLEIDLLNPLELEEGSRLETFATWALSGNEFTYIIKSLEKKIQDQPDIFKNISDIIISEQDNIIEAFADQYEYTGNHPASMDQFKHYLSKVQDSRVPNVLGEGHWRDYLKENLAKASLIKRKIDNFNKMMGAEKQFFEVLNDLINPASLNSALRARQASYEIIRKTNKSIKAKCTKNRDRTADGVPYLSQEGYGSKDNHDYKKAVLNKTFSLINNISGGSKNFSELGAQCYVEIANMPKRTYVDLDNGEAQCAYLLPFLPYNYDISGISSTINKKMCSGIFNTPNINAIVSAAYSKFLKEEHGITFEFIGSDNGLLPITEEEWAEICKTYITDPDPAVAYTRLGGLGLSERFLGWKDTKHFPFQWVRDSPSHNSGWNSYVRGFSGKRSKISIDRVFGTIIMYDYFGTGSAVKLYEWVSQDSKLNDSFKENYGYAKDWLFEKLHEEENKTKIYDKFEEEFNTAKKSLVLAKEEDFDDWKWDYTI